MSTGDDHVGRCSRIEMTPVRTVMMIVEIFTLQRVRFEKIWFPILYEDETVVRILVDNCT